MGRIVFHFLRKIIKLKKEFTIYPSKKLYMYIKKKKGLSHHMPDHKIPHFRQF